MPLFLPDDHDRLGVDLVFDAADNLGFGRHHGGIDVDIFLAAQLGIILIDIFQDILEGEALRAADNAHPFHGTQGLLAAFFNKGQGLFQFMDLFRQLRFPIIKKGVFQVGLFFLKTREVAPGGTILHPDEVCQSFFSFVKSFAKIVHISIQSIYPAIISGGRISSTPV